MKSIFTIESILELEIVLFESGKVNGVYHAKRYLNCIHVCSNSFANSFLWISHHGQNKTKSAKHKFDLFWVETGWFRFENLFYVPIQMRCTWTGLPTKFLRTVNAICFSNIHFILNTNIFCIICSQQSHDSFFGFLVLNTSYYWINSK